MRRNRFRPTGFNFSEVLFAVMILGIGFIMIAALFPVALSQTKATLEETSAGTVARGGIAYLDAVVPAGSMPVSGPMHPNPKPVVPDGLSSRGRVVAPGPTAATALWNAVKQNLVTAADNRYGAVLLYRRDGRALAAAPGEPQSDWSSFAHVIVIPVAMRNHSDYNKFDPNVTLQPQAVTFDVSNNRVEFSGTAATYSAAVEGAYLVIADDNVPNLPPPPAGTPPRKPRNGMLNGHIYQLGPNVDGNTWELVPNADFSTNAGPDALIGRNGDVAVGPYGETPQFDNVLTLTGATGFLVGRGYVEPGTPASGREGGAQDVAAYTTFVIVR